MAILANSYGTADDVAALSQTFTDNGVFSTTTRPTDAQVEGWINQVSSLLNIALAGESFTVPITQSDAILSCVSLVAETVRDMVAAANSTGRFFSERSLKSNLSMLAQIRRDITEWVESNASGLEEIGATRNNSLLGQIATNDTDVAPLFEREQYA